MTKPQFIQALLNAYASVSNNDPALTQAQAQTQLATAVGNAIDTYNASTGETPRVNSIKTQLLAMVAEMKRQHIAIGTNLNDTVLDNLLENINDI